MSTLHINIKTYQYKDLKIQLIYLDLKIMLPLLNNLYNPA